MSQERDGSEATPAIPSECRTAFEGVLESLDAELREEVDGSVQPVIVDDIDVMIAAHQHASELAGQRIMLERIKKKLHIDNTNET